MKYLVLLVAVLIASCSSKPVNESSDPIVAAIYVATALVREGKSNACDTQCKEEIKRVQASIKSHSKN